MKKLVALLALLTLALGHKLRLTDKQVGPDETSCPAGHCAAPNWFCCADNLYCALTEDLCPTKEPRTKPAKLFAKTKQGCCSGGTECPAGCCPEDNWFCCSDNLYCAATEAECPCQPDCPLRKTKLVKLAKRTKCSGGTMCPAGCCPEANLFCCADNIYCAATEAECPCQPGMWCP